MTTFILGTDRAALRVLRGNVAESLAGLPEELVANAQLVATELATNALLHAQHPIVVTLVPQEEFVRIEVRDATSVLPTHRDQGPAESTEGRGLKLINAVAFDWGAALVSDGEGKVVWAELHREGIARRRVDAGPSGAGVSLGRRDGDQPGYDITIGEAPTQLVFEATLQLDDLVREVALLAATGAALPPGLSEALQQVHRGFGEVRATVRRLAVAARQRGEARTLLSLTVPATVVETGRAYLSALEQVDVLGRGLASMTHAMPPSHWAFRSWYVAALVDQVIAREAGREPPPIPTFEEHLLAELDRVATDRQVAERLAASLASTSDRLARLQELTSRLTSAGDPREVAQVVVDSAASAFGAESARIYVAEGDELVSLSVQSSDQTALLPVYERLSIHADMPGSVAFRTGENVLITSRAELAERFPALAGVYPTERSLLVAPLKVGDRKLGVLSLSFGASSPVDSGTQDEFLRSLSESCAEALSRALATRAEKRAADRFAFLADASAELSGGLDHRVTLNNLARLAVERLADWCSVVVPAGDRLDTVAVAHTDADKLRWAEEIRQFYPEDPDSGAGIAKVIRTGSAEFYPSITDEMLVGGARDPRHLELLRELNLSSVIMVPLRGRTGHTIGALSLVGTGNRHYDESDLAFAEEFARRATIALETAYAFSEQTGRLEAVTRIADAAQRAILAPVAPKIGPLQVAARYVGAAAEARIGGDLYEVVRRESSTRLLVGDVRGKGLEAVRTATVVLGEFRSAGADRDSLEEVAVQIDTRLKGYLTAEDFVTAVIAEITDSGTLKVVCCGHPPALLLRAGALLWLGASAALPLGLGAAPTEVTRELIPGDRVILYTDGLLEARDADGRTVEVESLLRKAAASTVSAALDGLLSDLQAAVGHALGDDLALLAVDYVG